MSKKMKLSANLIVVSDCPIAKLTDENLEAIFKHLPPFERLIVSEVCSKWRDLSKTPWRDVTQLHLNHVPTQNIHAIIRKCPNIVSVSALRQNLGDLGRFVSRLSSNVASLKCVDCTFTIDANATRPDIVYALIRRAPFKEQIWHSCRTMILDEGAASRECFLPLEIPTTLRQLQLSALRSNANTAHDFSFFSPALLESMIVADLDLRLADECFLRSTGISARSHRCFEHLREFYFDSRSADLPLMFWSAIRRVEVLFLDVTLWATDLKRLINQQPYLRVLVLIASRRALPTFDLGDAIVIPVRKPHTNDRWRTPLAQLHLFLGKSAAKRFRFHPSPTDALKIYPIDAPLPQFLEKEEIKPIFEGSWIASRIKKGAKEGVNLADYSFEGAAESIAYVQL